MGIVITVRRDLKPTHQVFVCEMGAKRKGDIHEDCLIADPDLGVITSIGPQHLDTFGNLETVVSTKFELADWVKSKGGKMYLNGDNEYIKKNAENYDSVTYGTNVCDCKATDISYSPKGLTVTLKYKGNEFKVTSHLLGYHNALNIAAAASVALDLGLTPQEIAYAVSKLKPVEHRLQLKPYINGATLIDDAYNSNPEGCLEAVRVLGCFDGMKKILVTPGLVELGDKEYEANRRLGQEAAKHADVIILVGKKRSVPLAEGVREIGFPEENLYVVQSFKEAVGVFSPMCDKNTAILFENDLPDNYLE
jgi:UDP-N-acetylmuramoyl-tripeptide--D-alanyl-D-alanine ligase